MQHCRNSVRSIVQREGCVRVPFPHVCRLCVARECSVCDYFGTEKNACILTEQKSSINTHTDPPHNAKDLQINEYSTYSLFLCAQHHNTYKGVSVRYNRAEILFPDRIPTTRAAVLSLTLHPRHAHTPNPSTSHKDYNAPDEHTHTPKTIDWPLLHERRAEVLAPSTTPKTDFEIIYFT